MIPVRVIATKVIATMKSLINMNVKINNENNRIRTYTLLFFATQTREQY